MGMSSVIQGELFFFLISISTGVLIFFGYDVLRALRRVFPHGTVLLALEDFCYWCCSGIAAFCVIFLKNSGVLRGFSICGMLLGMMLYHKSVSSLILRVFSIVLKLIAGAIGVVCRIFLSPFVFMSKKIRKKTLKTLKNRIKTVRMTICKK